MSPLFLWGIAGAPPWTASFGCDWSSTTAYVPPETIQTSIAVQVRRCIASLQLGNVRRIITILTITGLGYPVPVDPKTGPVLPNISSGYKTLVRQAGIRVSVVTA